MELGWFLLFIGICIIAPTGLIGFELFYLLVITIAIPVAIGYGATQEHRVAIVAFVAIGFTFLVSIADSAILAAKVVHSNASAYSCIGAGAVFQTFAFLWWILVFGSGTASPVTVFVEQANAANVTIPAVSLPKFSRSKTTTEDTEYGSGPVYAQPALALGGTPPPPPVPHANAQPVVEFQARALHSYTANPADPNEISFEKGQILDIVDSKGKWWHSRYVAADGRVVFGIAPSNYLQQL
ncbi:Transmembrane osmosensor [Entophlyctis luteolus]|nr:Transmembrane osmosensor [Entophlyctis luteolus]KAJ3344482.1 Transmembrane osmosensor [Entophlyctis luteolus]